MKKTNKNKFISKYFKHVFLIICAIIWSFFMLKNTYYNKLFKEKGVCGKAKVIGVFNSSGKMITDIKYEFRIDGIEYTNKNRGSSSYKVGDSIEIIYLVKNPQINKPNELLNIDCDNN